MVGQGVGGWTSSRHQQATPPELCQQHQGFCGQTGTTWETRATGFCAETGALAGGWGSALLGACGRGRGRGSLQSSEPGSQRAGGGLWRRSRGAAPVKAQGCDTGWVASRRGPSEGTGRGVAMAMRWRPHVEIQGVTLLLTWWEETAYGGVWIGGWAPREGGGQMGHVTWESKG